MADLKLDSLVAEVLMNATNFHQGFTTVMLELDRIEDKVVKMGFSIAGVVAQVESVTAAAVSSLSTTLTKLAAVEGAIAPVATAIASISASVMSVASAAAHVPALGEAFKNIAGPITQLETALAQISKLPTAIQALTSLATADIGKGLWGMGRGLGKLATESKELDARFRTRIEKAAEPLGKIATEISKIDQAKTKLTDLVDGMQKVARNAVGMDKAAAAIAKMGKAFVDLTPLFDAASKTPGAITQFVASLTSMGAAAPGITAASASLSTLVTTMSGFGKIAGLADGITQVESISRFMVRMGRSATPIGDLNTHLNNLIGTLSGPGLATFGGFAKALDHLGNFLQSNVNKGRIDRTLPALGRHLRSFADDMAAWAGSVKNMGELKDAAAVFGKIGGFLDSARLFKYDAGHMAGVAAALNSILTPLGSAAAMLNIEQAGKAFGNIASLLRATGKTNATHLGTILTPVRDLMSHMATIQAIPVTNSVARSIGGIRRQMAQFALLDYGRLHMIGQSIGPLMQSLQSASTISIGTGNLNALSRLGAALARMSYVNVANLQAVANSVKGVMATLNAIPVGPNMTRLATVFNRVSNATSNMAAAGRAGGGGGGGGWFGGLFGGAGIPGGAARASASVNSMGDTFGRASLSANMLSGSLTTLRFTLAGFGIAAAVAFSQMDDALIRTMAHAGDYNQLTRGELFRGAIDLSGRSTSGAASMVKALDLLQMSGMSTGMAMRALSTAENLAVASGQDLVTTTRKLIDVQSAMGLNAAGVEENLTNLTMMADTFVGVASKVGSTEAQLMDTLTGRMGATIMDTGTSFEDAIAIMGVYSRMGHQFRGTAGGNLVARVIREINNAALKNPVHWQKLLGESNVVFDKSGNIKSMVDVITAMQDVMAKPGSARWMAEMHELGLNPKEMDIFKPLLESGEGLKQLREEIAMMGNIAKINADMIRTSLTSQFKMLWNNAVNLSTVIGDRLAPVFFVMTSAVRDAVQWFLKLNPAVQSLVILTATLAVAAGPVVMLFRALGTTILGLALAPVRLLASAFVTLWEGAVLAVSSVVKFAGVIYSGLGTALSYIKAAIVGVSTNVINLADLFFQYLVAPVVKGVSVIATALTSLFAGALVAGANLLLNIVPIVLGLVAAFFLLPAVLALVAAPLVTLGIGFVQLVGVVGGLLVKAWEGFKVAAVDSMTWAGRKVGELEGSLKGMWASMREGAAGFISQVTVAITAVAGFFWNFQRNMQAIMETMGRVGFAEAMFGDLTKAFLNLMEILGGNFARLAYAMGQTLVSVLKAAWTTVWMFVGSFFTWLEGNWASIIADLGNLLLTVLKNVAFNVGRMEELFSKLRDFERDRWINKWLAPAGAAEDPDKVAAARSEIIAKWFKGAGADLKGPLEGMGDLGTNFGLLKEMMGGTMGRAGLPWRVAGNEIKGAFGESYGGMKPLMGAFAWIRESPLWAELFKKMDFSIPEGAFAKAIESYSKRFVAPTERGETGESFGKGGPGFGFKQISLERMMVGGAAQENLDFQQLITMRQIDAKLAIIIQQRGWTVPLPTPAVGP